MVAKILGVGSRAHIRRSGGSPVTLDVRHPFKTGSFTFLREEKLRASREAMRKRGMIAQ